MVQPVHCGNKYLMDTEKFMEYWDIYDYEIIGDYWIGKWNVMFGKRIRAGSLDDKVGCVIDVCCGNDELMLEGVKLAYAKRMRENLENNKPVYDNLIKSCDPKAFYNDEYKEWFKKEFG